MRASQLAFVLAALSLGGSSALAQTFPICSDTFDYPFPGLLDGQNGGQGWADAWSVGANIDDIVIQANPPTNPNNPFPWTADDGIGNYIQQALEFGGATRTPDQTGHDDVVQNGYFGKDGSTIWVSFTTWNFQQFGVHFGALGFYDGNNEQWIVGAPWGYDAYGLDTCPGFGCVSFIPGTDDTIPARLVTRIDYMPGNDRVRMWVDPVEEHPLDNPDLDVMIPDLPWNKIRFWSGGNASLYYWDALEIEKGVPVPPVAYCFGDTPSVATCPCGNQGQIGEGCANSTGHGTVIAATGTQGVIADDFGIDATFLVPGQPALLFSADNAINGGLGIPFGDGFRCAGGNIRRLGVRQADAQGQASWGPGLSAAGGWTAGDTRRFQAWYRDPLGTPCGTGFNLSHGLEVFFSLY